MTNYLELLYLISFTGVLAVAYSYLLSGQIISSSPGNNRMQEIAEAIQIGAKAYLNRQYKTIAVVGVIVLAVVTYFFNYLVGLGYFIGAFAIFPFVYPRLDKMDMIENRHHSVILGKWIRYYWLWVTSPLFKFFVKFKFTPNSISALGTLLSVFAGAAFAFGHDYLGAAGFGIGGWFMVFGGSFDFMDGRVARETNQESLGGAFFDSCMDRVAECFVLAGLGWYFRDSWALLLVLAALSGSMLTSYSKCRGDKMGVNFGGGVMQRPERIVYIGVSAILVPMISYGLIKFWPEKFTSWKDLNDMLYLFPLGLVALLSNVTTYVRISNIMRLLDEKEAREKGQA